MSYRNYSLKCHVMGQNYCSQNTEQKITVPEKIAACILKIKLIKSHCFTESLLYSHKDTYRFPL